MDQHSSAEHRRKHNSSPRGDERASAGARHGAAEGRIAGPRKDTSRHHGRARRSATEEGGCGRNQRESHVLVSGSSWAREEGGRGWGREGKKGGKEGRGLGGTGGGRGGEGASRRRASCGARNTCPPGGGVEPPGNTVAFLPGRIAKWGALRLERKLSDLAETQPGRRIVSRSPFCCESPAGPLVSPRRPREPLTPARGSEAGAQRASRLR